jgi:hypothetical protein
MPAAWHLTGCLTDVPIDACGGGFDEFVTYSSSVFSMQHVCDATHEMWQAAWDGLRRVHQLIALPLLLLLLLLASV